MERCLTGTPAKSKIFWRHLITFALLFLERACPSQAMGKPNEAAAKWTKYEPITYTNLCCILYVSCKASREFGAPFLWVPATVFTMRIAKAFLPETTLPPGPTLQSQAHIS